MFAKYKSVIYESLMVILGCAIFGAGLDAFVLPHKLVSTGISGVGLILYYVTGLSVGSWNMILNIPIFWAAWKWLGTRVVIKTLYGTLMLSWMVDLFNFLQYDMIIKDPLLSSMMAEMCIRDRLYILIDKIVYLNIGGPFSPLILC